MKPIRNFNDAHAVLRPLYNNSRTKYDLNIMRRLMDYLGNPQEKLRVIHIAGTSGKTSTAYYIAALLKAAGHSVGLTVSPHVDEINERVQLNLVPLAEAEFCRELEVFMEQINGSKLAPSYFEAMVAFAYWVFAKQGVDYAVVEVGLGGLLDGTNVVDGKDKVCVITDIGLDHTEVLGDTLEEIAAQKAGIIQPENPVFMYEQDEGVVAVVRKACEHQDAHLRLVPLSAAIAGKGLPLFQQHNLGLAVQVVNFVLQRDRKPAVTDQQVNRAAGTRIPARMERFELKHKILIVDGSHNAQKLSALAESIRAAYPGQSIAALIAFVEGNESRWQGGADVLMQLADRIIITSFQAEQDVPKASVAAERVAAYMESQKFTSVIVQPNAETALAELQMSPEPLLLVAGSFYLLNGIRPLIVR